jgi:hypothetical protein
MTTGGTSLNQAETQALPVVDEPIEAKAKEQEPVQLPG